MLNELHIQNYVLIEQLTMHFRPGFNVLSGETGAGKSILLGALSLILGEKADHTVIRSGCAECVVSALYTVGEDTAAGAWIAQHGVSLEMGQLLIRRIIKQSGRGGVFIQSTPATLQDLAALTNVLIDIHGQHTHQSLLHTNAHRVMLDDYSHAGGAVQQIAQCHAALRTLKTRYDAMQARQNTHTHERELLQHAVKEIRDAALQPGEEEEIQQEVRILSQSENLQSLLKESAQLLGGSRGGILEQQQKVRIIMEQVGRINPALVKQSERLDSAYYEIEDVAQIVSEEMRNARYDPQQLQQHQQRLDTISLLQSKYGQSIEKINAYAQQAEEQIRELESWAENKHAIEEEMKEVQGTLMAHAYALSKTRTAQAQVLEQKIVPILHNLGITNADFRISVTQKKNAEGVLLCGAHGIDTVEFLIRTNSGEPLRGLAKIASGGEISRVMLALKTIFAESDQIHTMIFDEIDSGIGGVVARAVGTHLKMLAEHKQVLCVTHTASIAAYADHHLCVAKGERDERTVTDVRAVTGQEREREIARMLAGDMKAEESLSYAKKLLAEQGGAG